MKIKNLIINDFQSKSMNEIKIFAQKMELELSPFKHLLSFEYSIPSADQQKNLAQCVPYRK